MSKPCLEVHPLGIPCEQCEDVHPLGMQCELEANHQYLHESRKAFGANPRVLTILQWMSEIEVGGS